MTWRGPRWTPSAFAEYQRALREADQRLAEAIRAGDQRLAEERDRRYAEVNVEREKALKIKEEADKVALDLARQIQTYKDQQHNGLLDQLTKERVTRADVARIDAELDPLKEYIAQQTGHSAARSGFRLDAGFVFGAVATFIAVIAFLR